MTQYTDHAFYAGAAFIYFLSIVLAAIATPVVLYLYRKSLVKNQLMVVDADARADAENPFSAVVASARSGEKSIVLEHIRLEDSALVKSAGRALQRQLDRKMLLKFFAYLLSGLAYSVVFTTAIYLNFGSEIGRPYTYFVIFLFPFCFVLPLIYSAAFTTTLLIFLAYFFLLIATSLIVEPSSLTSIELATLTVLLNYKMFYAASVFLVPAGLFFLNRRIRSIGFMCAFFFIVALFGAYGVRHLFGFENRIGEYLGVNAAQDFFLNILLLAPLFAIPAWFVVKYLSGLYVRKIISDEKLIVDVVVFTFALGHSVQFMTRTTLWLPIGILAFLAYFIVSNLALILMFRKGAVAPQQTLSLLYLRVFDLGKKGEKFFNRFSKRWRALGNMNLISGVDLAKSTIEPNEFFDFVRGRMSFNFVKGAHDLANRTFALDRQADYDGRYRVNELFCHQNTWKQTMQHLASGSDVVLMDLRSFTDKNRGCLYELEQLIYHQNLDTVLLLIDSSTDTEFLNIETQKIWNGIDPGSPNYGRSDVTVKVYEYQERSTGKTLRHLEALLIAPTNACGLKASTK